MDEWYLDISNTPRAERMEYREKGVGRRARSARSRIGSRNLRFNPNAWDADNDGLVQDGTPFERPAIPGVNDFASGLRRRLRSAVGKKPQQQARRQVFNKPKLVDQLRRTMPARNQKPLNAHQRKNYKYGDVSELDGLEIKATRRDWLRGLTSDQISKLVVPETRDGYWEMWKDSKVPHMPDSMQELSQNLFKSSISEIPSREIDFSPEAVAEMQFIVKNSLDESPAFKWAVENFGMQFVVKRTDKAVSAFNDEPAQKMYVQDQISRGVPKELIATPMATSYGTLRTTFFNSGVSENFKFGEPGYTLNDLTVIDGTVGGAMRHEWGHYIMAALIEDDELPTTSRVFGGSSMYEAKAIAEKYNADDQLRLSKNLIGGLKDKSLPHARSAYAHTSMPEMFAEGMAAYLHPNDTVRNFAINDVLKNDIEKSIGVNKTIKPWENTGLSSGGRKSRRENKDQLRLDMDIPEANPTKIKIEETPLKKPKKPFEPRPPDNGPLTGKFQDIFRGVKSWEEFLSLYNSLEIVYFDYETTGLGENDRPIQLGAVRVKGGKIVDRFNVFMNPEKQLSNWSLENLKNADGKPLTQEWVSTQVSMKEAHAQFIAWAGPNQLLGGQYTPFDLGFLERTLKQQGLTFSHAGVIDSKAMADEILPRWSRDNPDGPFAVNKDTGAKFASSSLGPVAEFLGVDMGGGWHTADVDSETSALIVGKMIEYGIAHPEAPKTVLDIDGIPQRQEAKHIKYAKEMAEFPKKMAKYEKDLKEWEEFQALGQEIDRPIDGRAIEEDTERGELKKKRDFGLSSGAVDRNLKTGSFAGKSEVVKTTLTPPPGIEDDDEDDDDKKYEPPEYKVTAHIIGDKKVVFGQTNEKLNFAKENPDIEFLPINPYAISGYDPTSEEGRELALVWLMARVARLKENNDIDDTHVDALLYAGSRGDSKALEEMRELAKRGETYVEQERQFIKDHTEPLSEYTLGEIEKEGMEDFGLDDIFLVHETKYPPEYDKDGNIILRPLGDYGLTDPKTGKKYEHHRGTVHFALNHVAAGHMFRQREKDTYIYIVPLSSVIDRNPGSLDAIATVDTYLSPAPGEPLVLPNPKVINNNAEVEDIDAEVKSAIESMGGRSLKSGQDGTYTSLGQDARMYQIAKEMGVLTGLHADSIYGVVEDWVKETQRPFSFTARDIAKLGRNAMLRLANNDRFSATSQIYKGGLF